ncbi:MAG: hypothetical protein N3F66_02775 [Spirochaetes bacterium]|nr:hypothetical protein [Spirochaetota bacterium]
MGENDKAYQNLSEQTRKINIALHYTHGDMEKARQMVAGNYNDLYAIKVRFASSTMFGAFLLFFNHIYKVISGLTLILSPSYTLQNINPEWDWVIFEKEIAELMQKGDYDQVLAKTFRDKLVKSLDVILLNELSRNIESKNEIAIDNLFRKLIQETLALKRVDTLVLYQPISSLAMELHSITIPKLKSEIVEGQPAKKAEEQVVPSEAEYTPQVGVDGVKLIIKSALILSPIKGKHISKLSPGDRVMVSIIDTNPQAVKVAQALKAYENETFKPVPARITYVKYIPQKGYKVYGLIAKGIVVDIDEEEENIKVALDPAYAATIQPQEEEAKPNYLMMAILIILFGIIIGVLYFLLSSG